MACGRRQQALAVLLFLPASGMLEGVRSKARGKEAPRPERDRGRISTVKVVASAVRPTRRTTCRTSGWDRDGTSSGSQKGAERRLSGHRGWPKTFFLVDVVAICGIVMRV